MPRLYVDIHFPCNVIPPVPWLFNPCNVEQTLKMKIASVFKVAV